MAIFTPKSLFWNNKQFAVKPRKRGSYKKKSFWSECCSCKIMATRPWKRRRRMKEMDEGENGAFLVLLLLFSLVLYYCSCGANQNTAVSTPFWLVVLLLHFSAGTFATLLYYFFQPSASCRKICSREEKLVTQKFYDYETRAFFKINTIKRHDLLEYAHQKH